jgi:hypothetical protein
VKFFKSNDGQRPCLEGASIKNIYLFVVSCQIKNSTHIMSWRQWKPVGKGEAPSVSISSLQRQHLLWGARRKNKNRSRPFQPIVNSKHSLFSRWKICCALSVQSTSSVQTEVTILWLQKKPFRHHVHYVQHLHNILSGLGPARWLMNISLLDKSRTSWWDITMSGQWCPADTVHYF